MDTLPSCYCETKSAVAVSEFCQESLCMFMNMCFQHAISGGILYVRYR